MNKISVKKIIVIDIIMIGPNMWVYTKISNRENTTFSNDV